MWILPPPLHHPGKGTTKQDYWNKIPGLCYKSEWKGEKKWAEDTVRKDERHCLPCACQETSLSKEKWPVRAGQGWDCPFFTEARWRFQNAAGLGAFPGSPPGSLSPWLFLQLADVKVTRRELGKACFRSPNLGYEEAYASGNLRNVKYDADETEPSPEPGLAASRWVFLFLSPV